MKILVAIDDSPSSTEIVAEVSRRPWPAGSEIRIITVVPPLEPSMLRATSPTLLDEVVRERLSDATKVLNASAEQIRKRSHDVSVHSMLLEGRPKEVIVDEAERWSADLIVVGSHGYGTFRRLFLGSVSLAVASTAPCSVEIVRTSRGLSAKDPAATA